MSENDPNAVGGGAEYQQPRQVTVGDNSTVTTAPLSLQQRLRNMGLEPCDEAALMLDVLHSEVAYLLNLVAVQSAKIDQLTACSDAPGRGSVCES